MTKLEIETETQLEALEVAQYLAWVSETVAAGEKAAAYLHNKFDKISLEGDEEAEMFKSGKNLHLLAIENAYGDGIGDALNAKKVEVYGLKSDNGYYPFLVFGDGVLYRAYDLVEVAKIVRSIQADYMGFLAKYPDCIKRYEPKLLKAA